MRGVLKFKILRFIAKVKRKLADIENRFRDDPPHRLLGLPMMFGGFFLVILGVFMLVFPGPISLTDPVLILPTKNMIYILYIRQIS